MSIIWLFREYRDLVDRCREAEARVLELELQLSRRGDLPLLDTADAIAKYQESVLAEQPFADGRVPEHYWLTPGDKRAEE